VEWQHGARWFMRWLRDADLASNQHGWQWVAGSGTDAAPYFRVFNPVSQGIKFDPDGAYVRRYVPELSGLPGPAAHEPWKHPDGYGAGYPERIVDHAAERLEALARYREIKN
jgi:deoxyribodipyrimidine photo-lyase